jgi:hypothetical protein
MNLSKAKTIQCAALGLLLSGCMASIPPGTPTAMIRFTSTVQSTMSAACLKDRSLVFNGQIKNPYWSEVSPVKMIGTRSDKNNDVIERLMPAGREFIFRLGGEAVAGELPNTFRSCSTVFGFTPKVGEQYQHDFDQVGLKCISKLYRLSEVSGVIQRTPMPTTLYDRELPACS